MNRTNPPNQTRRGFLRRTGAVTGALALGVTATGIASADSTDHPAFPGRIYADSRLFATRDLTDLPAPNDNSEDSFDEIYVFANGADGQLPVAEAAPGESDYNGGRWSVTVVEWTMADPPVLTSDDAIHDHIDYITVVEEGARYFECPLVEVDG